MILNSLAQWEELLQLCVQVCRLRGVGRGRDELRQVFEQVATFLKLLQALPPEKADRVRWSDAKEKGKKGNWKEEERKWAKWYN
jgi:hypothetical protein